MSHIDHTILLTRENFWVSRDGEYYFPTNTDPCLQVTPFQWMVCYPLLFLTQFPILKYCVIDIKYSKYRLAVYIIRHSYPILIKLLQKWWTFPFKVK